MMGRFLSAITLGLLCLQYAANSSAADRYSASDFERVEKIDAHVHLNSAADPFIAQAIHDHFRLLTINVDYPDFPQLDLQQSVARELHKRYPKRVEFAAALSVADFQSPTWSAGEIRRIDAAIEQGAVGVKIWKNIGMSLRDPDGRYVMIDDPRIKPVIDHLEERGIVLLGHQAEPLNCWLPFDKMTVKGDREYFREHPQYYMYRHPEVPSHEAQLAARDRMLAAHPALRFDSVHLASLEWDVEEVARFLDRFPKANVDLAARMVHLQYQAATNPDKVRRFLIRYQDRILYGTDIAVAPGQSGEAAANEARDTWRADWQFLTSSGIMHTDEFAASFHALGLPKTVIDKIYRINAEMMYPQFL
jgi:Amidohydrolase